MASEDESSGPSVTPRTVNPLNVTRQRSNSWREKIIRGSLECDDEDLIIARSGQDGEEDGEGEKGTEDDESDDEDGTADQVYAWGTLIDKCYAFPSPLYIGMLGKDDFNVRSMACGDSHILLLTESGHVWTMGKADCGQLGLGDSKSRNTPKLVMFPTDQPITHIAACANHSACIDEIGHLSEWGQIHESRPIVSKPVPKAEFQNTRIERIALGRNHTIASTSVGKVLTWGHNGFGALGVDLQSEFSDAPCLVPIVDRAFEVAASSHGSACVTLKGAAFYWGGSWKVKEADKIVKPTKLPFRDPVAKIALGKSHVIALSVGNRAAYALGDNSFSQVGVGPVGPISGNHQFGEPVPIRIVDKDSEREGESGSPAIAPAAAAAAASAASPVIQTRGLRSASVAVEPQDNRSSGGGLRAAFKKMSSKQNLSKQAVIPSGTNSSSPSTAPPDRSSGGASVIPQHVTARGARSFSLTGGMAPLIRSRAEREADKLTEQSVGVSLGIKSINCGSKWSVFVTTDGQVWFTGEFQFGASAEEKVVFPTPTKVTQLADVMISEVAGSDTFLLANVGLRNEDDLKFQSFNPPTIKAASLAQLVNWICTDKTKPDPVFAYTIILTYHCFTTALLLIEKLRARHDQALAEGSSHAQNQICNFIIRWLQQRGEDFLEKSAREALDDFMKTVTHQNVVRVIERLLMKIASDSSQTEKIVTSSLDRPDGRKLDLLDYSPTSMAEAMTLHEHAIFAKIRLQEFIGQGWSKEDKATRCPGLTELIASFNKWSQYVAGSIINYSAKEQRNKMLVFWLEVHKQLFNLNNLACAVAVGAAFDLTPVYKLRNRNLIEMKSSYKKWLSYFSDLLQKNKAGYRKLIRKIMAESDPGIPYVGGHLSDLTFIEDGNKSEVDGLINVKKFNMMAKQIRLMDQLQKRKYTGLTPPAELRQFCIEIKAPSTSTLDEITERIIQTSEGNAPAAGASGGGGGGGGSGNMPLVVNAEPEDEFTSLTKVTDITSLLNKEGSAGPGERVAKWSKWRDRCDRQGEKFVEAWCASDAWRNVLVAAIDNPLTDSEARHFRDICRMFLLPAAEPDSVVELVLSFAATEPDPTVRDYMVSFCQGFKRFSFGFNENAVNSLSGIPISNDTVALASRKLQENMDAYPNTPRSVALLTRFLHGLAQSDTLMQDLKSPDREREFKRLEEERVSVSNRLQEEKTSQDSKLEQQRAVLAALVQKEQDLLEQLKKVQREKEEAEEALEKATQEASLEENNMIKKIEILDTALVDEEQSLKFVRQSRRVLQNYKNKVVPSLSKYLTSRLQQGEALVRARVDFALKTMAAFRSGSKANLKEFQDRVYTPLLNDLSLEPGLFSSDIAKLKEAMSEIHQ